MKFRGKDLAKQIEAQKRRHEILQLRLAGASYSQIAEIIERKYRAENIQLPRHWGPRYVWRDLSRELAKIREEIKEDVNEVRQMELARLDSIYSQLHMALRGGDFSVADKMLRVIDLRARLLGLFAPTSAVVTAEGPALQITISTMQEKKVNDGGT